MVIESDGTLVLDGTTPEDECTPVWFEEKYGQTNTDTEGKPICARPSQKGFCNNDAGWATEHPGYGPCVNHGGQPKGTLMIDPERNLTNVVQNEQLRAILAAEYTNQDIDGLDDEIVLMKALIKMQATRLGVKTYWDEDDKLVIEQDDSNLTDEAKEITRSIVLLSNVIKNKYQVLTISREAIPRDRVQAYVGQILAILNSTLRNTCESCKHEHNMQKTVIESLQLLGGI